MDNSSGVGVVDKVALLLSALEQGPASLAELVQRCELSRPTVHRLAVALAHHGLVARDERGRFTLGSRLGELAGAAPGDRLVETARPVLAQLRDRTGESAQLYRRSGAERVCVAAAEREAGLRDTVPVGAVLTLQAGSAAQVLLAWEDPVSVQAQLAEARFGVEQLAAVRRRGWAHSVGEREAGVASVSAPVRNAGGGVIAAICVSGPISRLTRQPGRLHAPAVVEAAEQLSAALSSPVGAP